MKLLRQQLEGASFGILTEIDLTGQLLCDLNESFTVNTILSTLSEIFQSCLTELKSFILDENLFRELPPCLGRLSTLTFLSMDHNRLSDSCMDLLHSPKSTPCLLRNLTVLSLGGNRLSSIEKLHLARFSNLTALFLHENYISSISDGLRSLTKLRELILDGNFIRKLFPFNFMDQRDTLQELRLDHNLLESFAFVEHLNQMRSLHLCQNRIHHVVHLESLSTLSNLLELSLSRNQLCRKRIFREIALSKSPSLKIIDGKWITEPERQLATTLSKLESPKTTVLKVLS